MEDRVIGFIRGVSAGLLPVKFVAYINEETVTPSLVWEASLASTHQVFLGTGPTATMDFHQHTHHRAEGSIRISDRGGGSPSILQGESQHWVPSTDTILTSFFRSVIP